MASFIWHRSYNIVQGFEWHYMRPMETKENLRVLNFT